MREYAIGTNQDLRSALTPESMRKLAGRGVERKFERGDCLFHQGDCAESILLLLDGRVKMCLIGSSGQKTILRIHLRGSLIGLSALASLPIRDATAIALETVTIAELTRPQLQAASVDQRLARVLLALGQRDPIAEATPTISLTHEDLSNMVGARRPTVTSA